MSEHRRLSGSREFVIILLTALSLILAAGCGREQKPLKVGILCGADPFLAVAEGFISKMTELGYARDKSIVYDIQSFNNDTKRAREALRGFAAEKVSLVLAFPTGAAVLAKPELKGTGIPLVFAVTNIEGSDLVQSIIQPGGNVTGVRQPGTDAVVKRLEILLELAPKVKRIAVLYDPTYSPSLDVWTALQKAAPYGTKLLKIPISHAEQIDLILGHLAEDGKVSADSLFTLPSQVLNDPRVSKKIVSFAEAYRIPAVGGPLSPDARGYLFAYTTNYREVGRMAASHAHKIFKGAPAGSIPVFTAESFLLIDHSRAEALGIKLRKGMLKQAAGIIR